MLININLNYDKNYDTILLLPPKWRHLVPSLRYDGIAAIISIITETMVAIDAYNETNESYDTCRRLCLYKCLLVDVEKSFTSVYLSANNTKYYLRTIFQSV